MKSMEEELKSYLKSLEHDDCYRVERVLKEGSCETTELVFFKGADGSELGPFVRKRFSVSSGLGGAYRRIYQAQNSGRRFFHLPRIEECYTAGEDFVVVSEYIHGETLADVVYRCDPSVALAADVFPRICEAVGEMHESFNPPLIHRDIKPSNIVLSQGALTLIDFGIARTYDDGADSDTLRLGTKAYAPPEQFGFGQTDARSDIYALGMILYYCLTERTPDAAARRVDWHAKGIPESLRRVIAKAVAFDPADRYASTRELEAAFKQALAALKPIAEPALEYRGPDHSVDSRDRGWAILTRTPNAMVRFLSRIPRWIGAVWDILLALFSILVFISAMDSSLNPAGDELLSAAPLHIRLAGNLIIYIFIYLPLVFAVCDRRPLYWPFKRLKSVSVPLQLGGCVVAMAVGFIIFALVTMQFN